MFFKHFASKYQLPDFYISGKLVENRLKTLVYACRYVDMAPLFGRVLPQFSMIFNQTMDFIDTNRGHRLQTLIKAGFLALVYKIFLILYTEKEQLLTLCGISLMVQFVLFADRKTNNVFCIKGKNVFMLLNFNLLQHRVE